jgi:5-methylcytosine-specific restriction endonuclease McrA
MKQWWTTERRNRKREEMMKRNPNARYHGLSAKAAAALVRSVGACEACGHDGSKSRLSVHHRNRDKHDHKRKNLQVLCHRCHMKEHRMEIGWAAYRKKKTLG